MTILDSHQFDIFQLTAEDWKELTRSGDRFLVDRTIDLIKVSLHVDILLLQV